MKYVSNTFESPTGQTMLEAVYEEKTKRLTLTFASGFTYPANINSTVKSILAGNFIRQNSDYFDNLYQAKKQLIQSGCEVRFLPIAIQ